MHAQEGREWDGGGVDGALCDTFCGLTGGGWGGGVNWQAYNTQNLIYSNTSLHASPPPSHTHIHTTGRLVPTAVHQTGAEGDEGEEDVGQAMTALTPSPPHHT